MKNILFLKRVLLVATLALLPVFVLAQVQEEWAVQHNGDFNLSDGARAMVVDSEGNVFVTGYTVESLDKGGANYATLKYNSSGQREWIAIWDGPGDNTAGNPDSDVALAIALDPAGNVYVTGSSWGINASDYATIKYDPNGNELWVQRYDGFDNEGDMPKALVVDAAGNVYVTGESHVFKSPYTDKDYATLKYNTDGELQWVARYSGPNNRDFDAAWAVAVDAQGNVYVTGQNNNDFATIKYNRDGVEQWIATFDGLGHGYDWATDIGLDAAGNIYITGQTFNGSDDEAGMVLLDYATIKYNPEGEQQWVRLWDSGGEEEIPFAMAVDAQGNVYVTGTGDYDYATVKYDTYGNEQWAQRYNGPGNGRDEAIGIAVDDEGSVYVTGESPMQETGTWHGANADIATVKYSASGEQQWVMTWGGVDERHDSAAPHGLGLDAAGNVYVSGTTTLSDGTYDMITIKYSQQTEPQCPGKAGLVAICHKGKTICISANALKAHLKHGDQLGDCNEMASNSRESDLIAFEETDLLQVSLYPNPVSGTAKIYYQLPAAGAVSIQVIDMQGRAVATVISAEVEAGNHSLELDTSRLQQGLYFLQVSLSTPRERLVLNKRMVVVR